MSKYLAIFEINCGECPELYQYHAVNNKVLKILREIDCQDFELSCCSYRECSFQNFSVSFVDSKIIEDNMREIVKQICKQKIIPIKLLLKRALKIAIENENINLMEQVYIEKYIKKLGNE